MIIVITNRKLPDISAGPISVADMGVVLAERTDDEDVIHTGKLVNQNKSIQFYQRGNEEALFSDIPADELNKPWVFFVHGFHQDPEENITKAVALEEHHEVNVITFAWPSRPVDEEYTLDDAKTDVVKSFIAKASLGAAAGKLTVSYVKGFLKDKWKNYPLAVVNAEHSSGDLEAAMKLVNDKLKSSQPPVLLVHSMGNFLMQCAIKKLHTLPLKFNNIVLHQADVNSNAYKWIEKLQDCLNEQAPNKAKLFITTNYPDLTLAASSIRRTILDHLPAERLGQTQSKYLLGDYFYLDFSDGEDVDSEHEFFKLKEKDTNTHVNKCLGRLFRAEEDQLPVNREHTNAGFVRMPTDIQLYRLEEIIDPVDGWEAEEPHVSPLTGFRDPLKPDDDIEEDDEY